MINEMNKKTVVYCNPDCYYDTDSTVLKYLIKEFNVIWYPIVHTTDPLSQEKLDRFKQYAEENEIIYNPVIINVRRRALKSWLYYYKLIKNIKTKNADIIFTTDSEFNWHIMFPFFMNNKNVVHGFHDVEHHSGIKFRFLYEKLNLLRSKIYKHYITFSKNQQSILKNRYGKDSVCVGMSIKDFGNSYLKTDDFNTKIKLLFFGKIGEYKGLDNLIDCMEECHEEGINNIQLSICGKGNFWNECIKHIKTKELYNLQIRFIDNSEIADLMSSHHFIILPYRNVTNSGPMMIGLNYCLPLVAPNIGSFKDVYSNKEGILYSPGQLKETLMQIAHMSESEYNQKRQACKILRDEFSEKEVAIRYIKYFNSIIDGKDS